MAKPLTEEERCDKHGIPSPGMWSRTHRCTRRAVVKDGKFKWCRQHSPVAERSRKEAASKRHAEAIRKHIMPRVVAREYGKLVEDCKGIITGAAGDNTALLLDAALKRSEKRIKKELR